MSRGSKDKFPKDTVKVLEVLWWGCIFTESKTKIKRENSEKNRLWSQSPRLASRFYCLPTTSLLGFGQMFQVSSFENEDNTNS